MTAMIDFIFAECVNSLHTETTSQCTRYVIVNSWCHMSHLLWMRESEMQLTKGMSIVQMYKICAVCLNIRDQYAPFVNFSI